MPALQPVTVGSYQVGGGNPLLWICGPCVIESHDLTLRIAETLRGCADRIGFPLVFKASFDKANRSSGKSFRGPGLHEGLKTLDAVKRATGLPVTTDIHECAQAAPAAEVCDVLQVPAFLARQTDLLEACGRTGRVVNVKKGQFMAPWDMKNVVAKLAEVGNRQRAAHRARHHVRLRTAGQRHAGGAVDARNRRAGDLRRHPQRTEAGGARGPHRRRPRAWCPYLARAAVAAGCDGVFVETHPNPDEAKSDGPNMIPLDALPELIAECLRIRAALSPTTPANATRADSHDHRQSA